MDVSSHSRVLQIYDHCCIYNIHNCNCACIMVVVRYVYKHFAITCNNKVAIYQALMHCGASLSRELDQRSAGILRGGGEVRIAFSSRVLLQNDRD